MRTLAGYTWLRTCCDRLLRKCWRTFGFVKLVNCQTKWHVPQKTVLSSLRLQGKKETSWRVDRLLVSQAEPCCMVNKPTYLCSEIENWIKLSSTVCPYASRR
jgi:hypothetical protein